MTDSPDPVTTDVPGLLELVGRKLGPTAWRSVGQEQVDAFADLTEDHNPIHVDPEAAAKTHFGGTIIHGYFTVALLAPLLAELLVVEGASLSINYGFDKLRFPSPVPVGADFRAGAEIAEAFEKGGFVEIAVAVTVEVRDAPKPALVAECRFRYAA